MTVNLAFRAYILDQLGQVAPVTSRPMFGGLTVFHQGTAFALVAEDRLFLKVDGTNRPDFEAKGMGPFLPSGDPTKPMPYYELPEDVLEDLDELRPWAQKAMEAAGRAAKGKKRRK